MLIKTVLRNHLTSVRLISINETGNNWSKTVTWFGLFEKQYRDVSMLKKIEPPVCIALLSIKARIWKQPKCSKTSEWIKKLCDTTGILCTYKRDEILKFTAT